ncbi:MAG: hypothetical protein MUF15_16990, partial [Acidobacteria bacterium]|nr:hypothetical protein [Acidobacteriota bacterium]
MCEFTRFTVKFVKPAPQGSYPQQAHMIFVIEYFKPGTEPVSICGVHRQYPVDRRTGMLAAVS